MEPSDCKETTLEQEAPSKGLPGASQSQKRGHVAAWIGGNSSAVERRQSGKRLYNRFFERGHRSAENRRPSCAGKILREPSPFNIGGKWSQ